MTKVKNVGQSIVLVLLIINIPLQSCSDFNLDTRSFPHVLINELSDNIEFTLFEDTEFQNAVRSFVLEPGDSTLIFECRRSIDEGFCDPFKDVKDGLVANFGSIIFHDGKRLNFERSVDTEYNLLLGFRYESIKVSDVLFVNKYRVGIEDYLKAE